MFTEGVDKKPIQCAIIQEIKESTNSTLTISEIGKDIFYRYGKCNNLRLTAKGFNVINDLGKYPYLPIPYDNVDNYQVLFLLISQLSEKPYYINQSTRMIYLYDAKLFPDFTFAGDDSAIVLKNYIDFRKK